MLFEEIKFESPGVLEFTLPSNIMESLNNSIDKLANISLTQTKLISVTNKLVGKIERSMTLKNEPIFTQYIMDTSKVFCNHFNIIYNRLHLENLWVNFQKKNEYNPLHVHDGNISFVIFCKIPFTIAEEDSFYNSVKSELNSNGRFHFIYNTLFGGTMTKFIDVDKSYEGKMFMFPNNARHGVYPFFTSDEYRITVAGNIVNR